MKSGCDSSERKTQRSVALPVLPNVQVEANDIRKSRVSRWRATALIVLNLLMIAHFIQWWIMGRTISPIEPSETMYTLQRGAVNAGFIFFSLALLATLIFGRFVCGWGCHIVALQDFCAWLLKKAGLTPRPFRSRLLIYVPLLAALQMFGWPTIARAIFTTQDPVIPQFTNHLVTTSFWETFPSLPIAIPFLFICGFMTVYFLGSKGFCTYACPYGGFFGVVDKLSPGRIRVTGDCNQCGHCTATCTSNVLVHLEVKQYGMVVDSGCMKCMDCISVCPNDALYFGFGKPRVAVSTRDGIGKNYSLTWPQEIAATTVFLASFFAVWDVYMLVPMLMALGWASVTTFLAIKIWKLLHTKDSSFYRFTLKHAGRLHAAGWVFILFASLWIALNLHSGWVRYHEYNGERVFQKLRVPDELALAQADARSWLSADDRATVSTGRNALETATRSGFFTNGEALAKLGWFDFLSGDASQAVQILDQAANHQQGRAKALSYYYRGAILNRLGRNAEAKQSLDQALSERSDLILAYEEKGESLWHMGSRSEAMSVWREALKQNPHLLLTANQLAGGAMALGQTDEALTLQKQADDVTPDDALYHWMLALRLQNLGMTQIAGKHFQRAIQLNPSFAARPFPR